jgi:hypothetical protein
MSQSRKKLVLYGAAFVACAVVFAVAWKEYQARQVAIERLKFSQELLCMALAYHTFNERRGEPPSELSEIEMVDYPFPRVRELVRKGEFVIRWKAKLFRSGKENDKYILGYDAKAPTEGGWVVFGGGGRDQVTSKEFGSYPLIPLE